jgi:glycosyltransferase involved in cell wall biosynthesis
LKANFIYSDLNPCGGGERLTLVTMQSVLEMGIDIELTTLVKPNIKKIENSFGNDLASVINKIKKIHLLNHILDEHSISKIMKNNYDIIINTHGDIDPYYNQSFSKNSAITYCHYPTAKQFMELENNDYLEKHINIAKESITASSFVNTNTIDEQTQKADQTTISFDRKRYLECLMDTYDKMMLNSTVITNSKYSSKAIFNAYGLSKIIILYPPVDVEKFRNISFSSIPSSQKDNRKDYILVISRIEPSKKLENAIALAKMLKDKKIGKGMIIVGNLEPFYFEYSEQLKKMIKNLDLEDYIILEIDASLEKLFSLLNISKVFFHPRSGEHFGMSIVEAMSSGLVPVVTDEGGQTEFVPSKYQYHTIEQAVDIVESALDIPYSERVSISDSVMKFSISNYKKNFQKIFNELLREKTKNNKLENKYMIKK